MGSRWDKLEKRLFLNADHIEYDLFGYDVTMSTFIAAPLKDQTTETMATAFRLSTAPHERVAVVRSDSANDIILALERTTVSQYPVVPYNPNSNLAERMRQTFADLSKQGPFCAVGLYTVLDTNTFDAVAQHWNACRSTVRLSIDGVEVGG